MTVSSSNDADIDAAPSSSSLTSSESGSDSRCDPDPAPRRYPRDWLRTLILSHSCPPQSSPSSSTTASLPAYDDPTLIGKALAVAPMVDQSDLPFRLLCRRYGSNVCWTPMIHARLFCTNPRYREKFWNWGGASWAKDGVGGMPAEDRPLIAQFCGSDPEYMLEAMRAVQHHVDGVDINCGCPQGIARKGRYGAFLLEEADDLVDLVGRLAPRLDVPLSVKVRILPSGVEDSLDLYVRLIEAGASMITVHGRNRHQKGPETGEADWDAIRRVREHPEIGGRVPVLANGGIGNLDDVRRCLSHTNCDGVMSSEGILEYPALFTETGTLSASSLRTGPGRVRIAREYLDLARRYPTDEGAQGSGVKCVRIHLHRFLHADLQTNPKWRDAVSNNEGTLDTLSEVLDDIEAAHGRDGHRVEEEKMSWYMRHRGVNENGVNVLEAKRAKEKGLVMVGMSPEEEEDCDDAVGGCGVLFEDDSEGDY